ncbi:MAG: LysM peptidoglycan-binding domain-containing protein [Gemmatimonadetes bacterium]|nr:LysM peptidoglycan-binding domain-containing protein [Gemmatimonadota bacterium]
MERASAAAVAAVLVLSVADAADAQSLRGSKTAMHRQNVVAQQHDYTFIRSSDQVRSFVASGYLERLSGNADYALAGVSHPYARPAVRLFVERLSAQYRAACGEKLVVTSLTRPVLEQPRNASDLSVHPAGMAVDLRISRKSSCVRWIEKTLLSLEKQGVLDATRESRPPHYHVALFPEPYTRYVASIAGKDAVRLASAPAQQPAKAEQKAAPSAPTQVASATDDAADLETQLTEALGSADAGPKRLVTANVATTEPAVATYEVNRGDSLWSIARRHNTTVDTLKSLNSLSDTRIIAGQTIAVPVVTADAEES